jgi:chemotaxis protein MotB
MIKRRPLENKVGPERWLVSYADFITLLFAFFVVMYSVSQVNENKYKTLSETLSRAFSSSSAPSPEQTNTSDVADLNQISESLSKTLLEHGLNSSATISANEQWLELSLESELLFASGSAEPSADAQFLFVDIAQFLKDSTNEIQIAGHTDNIPINNDQFQDNWALSSARALSVLNLLVAGEVESERLSAVGYGEHRPLADNNTEDGRRENRRVVLRVGHGAVETPSRPTDEETVPLAQTELIESAQNLETSSGPREPIVDDGRVQPVRLKGGDLLFTSDPELPRLREREEE